MYVCTLNNKADNIYKKRNNIRSIQKVNPSQNYLNTDCLIRTYLHFKTLL